MCMCDAIKAFGRRSLSVSRDSLCLSLSLFTHSIVYIGFSIDSKFFFFSRPIKKEKTMTLCVRARHVRVSGGGNPPSNGERRLMRMRPSRV